MRDYPEDYTTVNFKFPSKSLAGVPTAISGGVFAVYKANNTTQSTAGLTFTGSFDSVTGLNNILIDLSSDAFYVIGQDYQVVATAGTVDSVSIIGEVVYEFSIENEFMRGTDLAGTAAELAKVPKSDGTSTWNATALGSINAECDTAISDYDGPTNTEMNARTILAAAYFDPAVDAVATVTTLTNKTGFSLAATGLDAIVSTATGMIEIAKAIWDRTLTVGNHNIVNSAGRIVRSLEIGSVLHADDTQAGSTDNIVVLASAADTSDDFYNDQALVIDGEARIILGYVGSTRSATLHRALVNGAPSNNTAYEVLAFGPCFATALGGTYANLSIHIAVSGSLTAIIDRDGLDTNPIDDGQLTNARTVADAKNLDSFVIGNGATITLNATYENWGFAGPGSTVDTGGQSISNSRFTGCTVQGASLDTSGGAVVYSSCRIAAHSPVALSGFNNCDLVGPLTLAGATTFRFKDCAPILTSGCTFDFGAMGNQDLLLLNWNDGATIQNLGNTGADTIVVTGNGHITLEASCVGGTIIWSGDIKFTDNGSGITFVQGLIGDIVDDTGELQADWANGGRLDNILDARMAEASINTTAGAVDNVTLTATATDVTNRVTANTDQIAGDATAATNLQKSALAITPGAAIAGTLSTTEMTTDLTEATDDHYNGLIIKWTSGALNGQGTDITDYEGATKKLTYTATTEAPAATDTFVIL